jgi:hypothetical protein
VELTPGRPAGPRIIRRRCSSSISMVISIGFSRAAGLSARAGATLRSCRSPVGVSLITKRLPISAKITGLRSVRFTWGPGGPGHAGDQAIEVRRQSQRAPRNFGRPKRAELSHCAGLSCTTRAGSDQHRAYPRRPRSPQKIETVSRQRRGHSASASLITFSFSPSYVPYRARGEGLAMGECAAEREGNFNRRVPVIEKSC